MQPVELSGNADGVGQSDQRQYLDKADTLSIIPRMQLMANNATSLNQTALNATRLNRNMTETIKLVGMEQRRQPKYKLIDLGGQ